MNSTSNKPVSYISFGSFQRPSHQASNDVPLKRQYHQNTIRDEVTSSFDVKPLNAKPTFPRQAQVLPIITCDGSRRTVFPGHSSVNPSTYHHAQSYQAEFQAKQDPRNHGGNGYIGDENFVYIHRHNSFIDVSKMTHHDHSNPSTKSNMIEIGSSSRSHDEVDAALTLATGLREP